MSRIPLHETEDNVLISELCRFLFSVQGDWSHIFWDSTVLRYIQIS